MFGLTFGKTKFRIRVLYKSGNSHVFWAYSFSMSQGAYRWTAVSDSNRPLFIGVDDIEAVYQVGVVRSVWDVIRLAIPPMLPRFKNRH